MNILIILSHPNPESFNHALAQKACQAVIQSGGTPWFHDLHAEGFDPILPTEELNRIDILPPLIQQHTQELSAADGIILIHPNWWSAPPAMMAGWRDRCIRAGLAYRFETDSHGNGYPVGMLHARFLLLINTLNTPINVETDCLGNPIYSHWQKIVFGLCGIKDVDQKLIGPVITSSQAQRTQWLNETQEMVTQKLKVLI